MGRPDALGLAGRARRVHDVGEEFGVAVTSGAEPAAARWLRSAREDRGTSRASRRTGLALRRVEQQVDRRRRAAWGDAARPGRQVDRRVGATGASVDARQGRRRISLRAVHARRPLRARADAPAAQVRAARAVGPGRRARHSVTVALAEQQRHRRRAAGPRVSAKRRLMVCAAAGAPVGVTIRSASGRRSASRTSRNSPTRLVGRSQHGLVDRLRCCSIRSMRARLEQVGAVLDRAAQPVGAVRERIHRRSNFTVVRSTSTTGVGRRLAAVARRIGVKLHDDLEQRIRARARSGCSSSTSRSNGRSWCVEGGEAVASTRRSSSRNGWGLPERSLRSTSVLTNKPISGSSSQAVAIGDRRTDDDVILAAVAVQQRLEAGEQRHEQRGAFFLRPAARSPSRRALRQVERVTAARAR